MPDEMTDAEKAALNRAQCPPVNEWPADVLKALDVAKVEHERYLAYVTWPDQWTRDNCIRPHWDLGYIAKHADAAREWVAPA